MDDLLTPVSQTYVRKRSEEPVSSASKSYKDAKIQDVSASRITSSTDALELLKSQPGYDALVYTLNFISQGDKISKPSPDSAQIIQVLVSEILPNYWPLLRDGKPTDLALFLRCLSNVTGVNALTSRLKSLIQESKESGKGAKRPDISIGLDMVLEVAEALLAGDEKLLTLWHITKSNLDGDMKKKTMGHEFASLFSGGRIVSAAAEVAAVSRQDGRDQNTHWISDGLLYTGWLGRSISAWMTKGSSSEDEKLCSDLFAKALRLGYSEHLIKQLVKDLLLGPGPKSNAFLRLFGNISQLDQKRVLYAVIKYLAEVFLNNLGLESSELDNKISAAAGAIETLTANEESRQNHLVAWLTSATGAGLGDAIGIRRAVLAALAKDKDVVATVLEKSLSQFGDQLYIKHSPILQQEAHAQVLLLSAGYVHRASPLKLKMLMRGSTYLHTISNRLEASQSRSKFLGMVIGEALSSLSDASQTKLDFQMDQTTTDEGRWYKSLTDVADQVGPIGPILTSPRSLSSKSREANTPPPPKSHKPKPATRRPAQPAQSGFVIEEVEDSDQSEDDDLVPYAKPDSDAEDSDDDPTLVSRDKPKAPVYVRDLIAYFRDTEHYDKQKLALNTAPSLIRRKANFGTEVSEHANELASLVVGLQDKFEMDGFHELRLQGMQALVVAQPEAMAPWFSKTFFDGDYSISQRASILVILGLAARELAGFDVSEYASAASFPSKRLPERMERLYIDANTPGAASHIAPPPGSDLKAIPSNALDTMASDLTSSFLAPLAAEAADSATGPDVLKLATFTSRLDSNAQGKGKPGSANPKTKPRVRSIPNTTASLLANCFFAPLSARFQHALRSSNRHSTGVIFQSHLLALYLKTLAVLVHAAGPSTLSLPQMTAELWDLLLGVRGHVGQGEGGNDITTTHALLVALAAMLEVNDSSGQGIRRLCVEMPREFVETQEWVAAVYHGTRGGDEGGEENQVKILAAGVLITLQEAMEKHRAFLVGDMIGM